MMDELTAVVIDDDQSLTPIVTELLTAQRIKLAGIGFSGTDAIRLVKANNPVIVFLNIKTPQPDLIDTLKEIRSHDNTVHIVVAISNGDQDVKELVFQGANSIIFKPFDKQKIEQIIGEINNSIPKWG